MTSQKTFLIAILYSLIFCQVLICKEKLYDDYSGILNKWEKAVIVEGHINALLPYNLENKDKPDSNPHQLLVISLKNTLLTIDEECIKTPVRIDETIDITYIRFNKILQNYSKNHPTTWDISSEFNLYFNDLSLGAISEIYNSVNHHKKYVNPINKSIEYMHSNSHKINYSKVFEKNFVKEVNEEGNQIIKKIPFDPLDGLNNSLICKNDKTVDIFLFNQNQVLVWQVDFNKEADQNDNVWKFLYAFKMPMTTHFEVCRIWDDLYILTNKHGIYKLDIEDAKKNAPEPPNNVFKKYSNHTNLIWDGFQQEHIVENKVKAEKISDLNYNRYVVDKDSNTAYIISDGYLYELDNLKIRSKIPELRKTENFVDAEAEYMRAVLEAIYNLGRKPETTPAALLKVTPDSELDKKLAEENANASNPNGNANGESDDDGTETDVNKKNGNANTDADINSDESTTNNSNGSEDADSQKLDAKGDNNTNNKNSDNVNEKSGNAMDGSNFAIYAGGGLIVLILITVIFIVLSRRKH